MTSLNFETGTVWNADNLDVMRGMNSETIDLIYLDPPFNSGKQHSMPLEAEMKNALAEYAQEDNEMYNEWSEYIDKNTDPKTKKVLLKFNDTWNMDSIKTQHKENIKQHSVSLHNLMEQMGLALGERNKAYLIFTAVRLIEMQRILKKTGSIYLHCDDSAGYYIKMIMDSIFKKSNFRDTIHWKRTVNDQKGNQYKPAKFGRGTDYIFHYSKTDKFKRNRYTKELPENELLEKFPETDEQGRRYNTDTPIFSEPSRGARPNLCYEYKGVTNPHPSGWRVSKERLIELDDSGAIIWREGRTPLRKSFADDYAGETYSNLWDDIEPAHVIKEEYVGYPTQKPLKLLRRIIEASTEEGDIVLDPFAGCATALVSAYETDRRWVGIDTSFVTIPLIKYRLKPRLNPKCKFRTYIKESEVEKTNSIEEASNRVPRRNVRSIYGERLYTEANGRCQQKDSRFKCDECKVSNINKKIDYKDGDIDHIVPLNNNGTNEYDNLQFICSQSHRLKSGYEKTVSKKSKQLF